MIKQDIDGQQQIQGLDNGVGDSDARRRAVLRQYMYKISRRVYMLMLGMILLVCIVYGVTITTITLTKSYTLIQNINSNYNNYNNNFPSYLISPTQTNIINQIFLRSCGVSQVYLAQYIVVIQSSLLLLLLVIVTLVAMTIIKQLIQITNTYHKTITRQQSYSLSLTLNKPIHKTQIKLFIEYFQTIVTKAIQQKLFTISVLQQKSINKQQIQQMVHYLQAIVDKLKPVHDVVLLPEMQSSQIIDKNNQNNNLQQQPLISSHYIIAIFSYPEIKHILLQWYLKQQNKLAIQSQITHISTQTPSPQDYIFEKLNNNNGNSLYKDKHKHFRKYVILGVVIQVSYIILLSILIYFRQFPHTILPQPLLQSYSINISYTLLVIQSIVMLIYRQLFIIKYINNTIIKSIPTCVTRSKQITIQCYLNVVVMIINLLIVPFVCMFLILLAKSQWMIVQNIFVVLLTVLWGQCQFGYLIMCYVVMKWIVYECVVLLITKIKNCNCNNSNKNNNSNNTIHQSTINNNYQHTITQSTILFTTSILLTPIIAIILTISLLITIITNNIQPTITTTCKYQKLCLTSYIKCLINKLIMFLFVIILLGGVAMNCALLGIGYKSVLSGKYYMLIVSVVVSVGLIVGVVIKLKYLFVNTESNEIINNQNQSTFINNNNHKSNIKQKQYLSKNKLMPHFPFKQLQNNDKDKADKQNNNNKQKIIALNLINKIYTNQQFLYTYDEQLRKNTFFNNTNQIQKFQIINNNNVDYNFSRTNTNNKKSYSTNKITQQLHTMSRSLQETLKQRLMASSANPFRISLTNKQLQDDFDFPYQKKVNMTHSKPKTVRIPILTLPNNKQANNNGQQVKNIFDHQQQRPQQQFKRKNTNQKKQTQPNKQPNELRNKLNNIQNNKYKKPKPSQSDPQCDILSSFDKQEKFKLQEDNNNNAKIQDELYHKKIKFTDLFDSDDQSIKNKVKKKIKMSIQKIQY